MILEIVINHWKEPWEIGEKAIRMLGLQRCVNWDEIRVTMIHDGSDAYPKEYFEGLPFEMHQETLPQGGIAKARNWAIAHSEAEWVKFCDFDDMFSGAYSVRDLVRTLKKAQGYDLLWFPTYLETMGGELHYCNVRDPVVIHGKAFRVSFLREHGLKFPEHLTWCEDSAFLAELEMEIDTKRVGKIRCETPIYAWIERNGSLCNRDDIKFANLQSFFERHKYVAEAFHRHGHYREECMMNLRLMMDSYYTLYKAGIKEDTSEFEKKIWDYYEEHKEQVLSVPEAAFNHVLKAVNLERKDGNITGEEFREWLRNHDEN